MRFLKNWTIDISELPEYVKFNKPFSEYIDLDLAKIILECDDERISNESREEFRKLVERINKHTQLLSVKYSPRKGGLGRRYPDCPNEFYEDGTLNPNFKKYYSALIAMPRIIKNTLYHYMCWKDYDQVKGHPTLLYELATRNNITVPSYADYLKEGRFDEIVKELSAFYSADEENPLTKKDIKWLFNKTIYGGNITQWIKDIENGKRKNVNGVIIDVRQPKELKNKNKLHPIYTEFLKDTKTIIDLVYMNNRGIQERVCDNLPDITENLWERKNRVMSYFCGILEHEITNTAYEFAVKNENCQRGKVGWGYDGFTIPPCDKPIDINAMNEHIKEKTKFKQVRIIEKPFDDNEILHQCIERRRNMTTETLVVENASLSEYETWKLKFELDWCKIQNTAMFVKVCKNDRGEFEKYVYQDKKKLRTAYEHECYTIMENGRQRKCKYIDTWFDDPKMRCYQDAQVVPPPLVCPEHIFNLWQPSPFELHPIDSTDADFDAEGVEMWTGLVRTLSNNEVQTEEYLHMSNAQAIQEPAKKTGVLPVLVGDQGIGKSIYAETLGKLHGAGKLLVSTSPENDVWGKFNSPMSSAFIVVLNEVDKRNAQNAEGKIKGLITDETILINCKGKDAFPINSYHRFLMTTNNYDPIKTEQGDRRTLIIRCSDENKGNNEYFKRLTDKLNNYNTLRSIYWCYKKTDISKWECRNIPRTEYQKTIMESSKHPVQLFMENFIAENETEEHVDLTGSELITEFTTWCNLNNFKKHSDIDVAKFMKQLRTQFNIPKELMAEKKSNGTLKRRYDIQGLKKHFKIDECLLV